MTPEENRKRCKLYYQSHKDKISEKKKKERKENPTKYSKRWKEYRNAHLEEERLRSKKYRADHPEKMKELCKKWNEENNDYRNELSKKWRKNHKRLFNMYKINGICENCGTICTQDNVNIFSFHHKNPEEKSMSLAYMASHKKPFTEIIMEIEKCSLICENCHRRIHYNPKLSPNPRVRKLKEWYNQFMSDKKCEDCGESDKCCLDWHHINPSNKKYEISFLLQHGNAKETVEMEIEKCICLCANCHRLHHLRL